MFVINSEFLKDKIESLNYTQASFAEELNMTPANFSYLLNNKTKSINLEICHKICKLLNIELAQLIVDNEIKEKTTDDLLEEIYNLADRIHRTTISHKTLVQYEKETGEKSVVQYFDSEYHWASMPIESEEQLESIRLYEDEEVYQTLLEMYESEGNSKKNKNNNPATTIFDKDVENRNRKKKR